MKIKAVGINRAETLHRMGKYPINKEVEKYLGLEASGEVIDPTTKYILMQCKGSFIQWNRIIVRRIIRPICHNP